MDMTLPTTVLSYRVYNVAAQLDMVGSWDTDAEAWAFIHRNDLALDTYVVRTIVELINPELSE